MRIEAITIGESPPHDVNVIVERTRRQPAQVRAGQGPGVRSSTASLARKLHRFAKRGRGDGQAFACFAPLGLSDCKANARQGAQAYLSVRSELAKQAALEGTLAAERGENSQIRVRSRESVKFSGGSRPADRSMYTASVIQQST